MGRITIKQDNGKYAVWSTVVDNFIMVNADKEDLIELQQETFNRKVSEENVDKALDRIEKHGSYKTMEEALDWIEEVHGKEERVKAEKWIAGELETEEEIDTIYNQFGYCCDHFYEALCTEHIKLYKGKWVIESDSKQRFKSIAYCPFCSKELSNFKGVGNV